MPALNFSVFREKIENGSKRQTIRLPRKRPIKVGDKLYLYWKMRTKSCRPILVKSKTEPPICTVSYSLTWSEIWDHADYMARLDGFDSRATFLAFFEQHYHPEPDTLFDVIRW